MPIYSSPRLFVLDFMKKTDRLRFVVSDGWYIFGFNTTEMNLYFSQSTTKPFTHIKNKITKKKPNVKQYLHILPNIYLTFA